MIIPRVAPASNTIVNIVPTTMFLTPKESLLTVIPNMMAISGAYIKLNGACTHVEITISTSAVIATATEKLYLFLLKSSTFALGNNIINTPTRGMIVISVSFVKNPKNGKPLTPNAIHEKIPRREAHVATIPKNLL